MPELLDFGKGIEVGRLEEDDEDESAETTLLEEKLARSDGVLSGAERARLLASCISVRQAHRSKLMLLDKNAMALDHLAGAGGRRSVSTSRRIKLSSRAY